MHNVKKWPNILLNLSGYLVKHNEPRQSFCFQSQSRHACSETSLTSNVVFIHFALLFSCRLFCYWFIFGWSVSITQKNLLLSYCFSCKWIQNNLHGYIVINSMYVMCHFMLKHFHTFYCVNFSFFFMSNSVYLLGGVFFYLKLFP